ncbi:MAG: type IV secretion protein IcmK [Gammaproteobacteria bacterium]|nr:type IV secretion protein IcmK [Gammaproteobacteria bacterium]
MLDRSFFVTLLLGIVLLINPTYAFSAENTADEQAFDIALQRFFPLSPEQIETVLDAYDRKTSASSIAPHSIPVPVTSTKAVALSPGSEIPLVRLCKGFISSVIFVDETGQPWPVVNYSLGNPDAFDISWDSQSHTLFIQSLKSWAVANIGVRLQGLATPIMINLVSSQGEVDYRIDMAIPAKGPFAKATTDTIYSATVMDATLLPYLDGTPPSYAVPLVVDPVYAQAWSQGEFIIVRTRETLISPRWMAQTMSSDGTKVYRLAQTNTIVIARNGSPKTLSIKGF